MPYALEYMIHSEDKKKKGEEKLKLSPWFNMVKKRDRKHMTDFKKINILF